MAGKSYGAVEDAGLERVGFYRLSDDEGGSKWFDSRDDDGDQRVTNPGNSDRLGDLVALAFPKDAAGNYVFGSRGFFEGRGDGITVDREGLTWGRLGSSQADFRANRSAENQIAIAAVDALAPQYQRTVFDSEYGYLAPVQQLQTIGDVFEAINPDGGFFGRGGPYQAFSQTIGRALLFTGVASFVSSVVSAFEAGAETLYQAVTWQAPAAVVDAVPSYLAPGETFNGLAGTFTSESLAASAASAVQAFPYQTVADVIGKPIEAWELAPPAPGGQFTPNVPNVPTLEGAPPAFQGAPTLPAQLAPAVKTGMLGSPLDFFQTAAKVITGGAAVAGAAAALGAGKGPASGTGGSAGSVGSPNGPGLTYIDLGGTVAPTLGADAPAGASSSPAALLALVGLGAAALYMG